jgi:hypothetical protein
MGERKKKYTKAVQILQTNTTLPIRTQATTLHRATDSSIQGQIARNISVMRGQSGSTRKESVLVVGRDQYREEWEERNFSDLRH